MNIKTEAVVSSKNNVPRIHVKKEEEEEGGGGGGGEGSRKIASAWMP